MPSAPGCSQYREITTVGSTSGGKVDQGARGSNERECESVGTRSGCMTSAVVSAVDQGNCILRPWWGNTAPAETSSYLEWTGMTEARDAAVSAQIG